MKRSINYNDPLTIELGEPDKAEENIELPQELYDRFTKVCKEFWEVQLEIKKILRENKYG